MSNNERPYFSVFEGDSVTENSEEEQVTITQSELKEIFQKLNLSGKQILNIDKKVFEKLEAYMKQVERLNDYKSKIARKELQKYIIPVSKVIEEDGSSHNYLYETYVNRKSRGKIRFYTYASRDSVNYNIVSFRDFKYIVAGTQYGYLSDAFFETGEYSEEEQYIDLYLWILDKGGKVEAYKDWSKGRVCKIYFPKK